MKELSIEEKAKRYESALEKCRKLYKEAKANEYTSDIEDYETIFPELKESEDDESTRKRIIALVNAHSQGRFRESMLAWFEKEGQSRQVSIWKHWKDGICGNGEGKPIYLIKNGDAYRISSVLGSECDYIKLSELDNLMLEKQEVKKIENRPLLSDFFNAEYERGKADALKSIEWSDEDEQHIDSLLKRLDGLCRNEFERTRFAISEDKDWLESLKQSHVWKPSEAQMRALHDISLTGKLSYAGQGQSLIELYNDLRKL